MPRYRPYFHGRSSRYRFLCPVITIRQLAHEEISNQRLTQSITLLCADWNNPLNVGSAFRLADATGIREIVLAGTTPTPPNQKISKTARSTVRSVPYTYAVDAAAYLQEMKARGQKIIALEITNDSESLFTYRLPESTEGYVIVAGSEARGIPEELLALCDDAVHLPMYGQNTSMNLAVALGAAVYLLLMQLE